MLLVHIADLSNKQKRRKERRLRQWKPWQHSHNHGHFGWFSITLFHERRQSRCIYVNDISTYCALDHRLNTEVLTKVFVNSGIECVLQCLDDGCCRSVNYRKKCLNPSDENCELLHILASEMKEEFESNKDYDHYILLEPKRVISNYLQYFNKNS